MVNFADLRWQQIETINYKLTNDRDFKFFKLTGSQFSNLIRVSINNFNRQEDYSGLFFGTARLTVKVLTSEATIYNQNIFFGENLIVVPNYIDKINNVYLDLRNRFLGDFSISSFKPSTQVVINPLTGQPVILGQEALTSIENINQVLNEALLKEITDSIRESVIVTIQETTTELSREVQQISENVINIENIL